MTDLASSAALGSPGPANRGAVDDLVVAAVAAGVAALYAEYRRIR